MAPFFVVSTAPHLPNVCSAGLCQITGRGETGFNPLPSIIHLQDSLALIIIVALLAYHGIGCRRHFAMSKIFDISILPQVRNFSGVFAQNLRDSTAEGTPR